MSTDNPAANQLQAPADSSVPEGHQLITEGSITMMYPQTENSVFYNPVQVQNRDLSILMIGMYAQRKVEKDWVKAKRKEVRKELLANSSEAKGGKSGEKLSKEERKKKIATLELEIEERVQKDKEGVDFVKLTKESGCNSSSTTNSDTTLTGLTILDALAASGLRSLRYWKEIPGIKTMVVNDVDPVAIELAKENVVRNGMVDSLAKEAAQGAQTDGKDRTKDKDIDGGTKDNNKQQNHSRPPGIILQTGDATHEMYLSRLPPSLYTSQQNPSQIHQKPQYDVIDLDPYGSASPFLDAALQSIANGGLLAVTCTDMAALGGSHPETCYGRYAAFPISRAGYLQELALRILLYQLSVVAGRYGRSVRPVLSVGMAFYCRVFVEVWDDKAGVSLTIILDTLE